MQRSPVSPVQGRELSAAFGRKEQQQAKKQKHRHRIDLGRRQPVELE
jgi:hypothetical protein